MAQYHHWMPHLIYLYSINTPNINLGDFSINNIGNTQRGRRAFDTGLMLKWGQTPMGTNKSYNDQVKMQRGKRKTASIPHTLNQGSTPTATAQTPASQASKQSRVLSIYKIGLPDIDTDKLVTTISKMHLQIQKQVSSDKMFSFLLHNGHWEQLLVISEVFDPRIGVNMINDYCGLIKQCSGSLTQFVKIYFDLMKQYKMKFELKNAIKIGELQIEMADAQEKERLRQMEQGQTTTQKGKEDSEELMKTQLLPQETKNTELKTVEKEDILLLTHVAPSDVKSVVTGLESLMKILHSVNQYYQVLFDRMELFEAQDLFAFVGVMQALKFELRNMIALRPLLVRVREWCSKFNPKSYVSFLFFFFAVCKYLGIADWLMQIFV